MKKMKYMMIPFGIVMLTGVVLFTFSIATIKANENVEEGNVKTIELKDVKIDENSKKSPTIKVDDDISVEEETDFKIDKYVKATDSNGKSLKLVVLSNIDTKKVGDQTVTVTATDSNGNFTQKEVKVTVTPKPTPTPEPVTQEPVTTTPQTNTNRNTNQYNNRQTYTPSYQAPATQPAAPAPAQPAAPSGGTTYYAPEENNSGGGGFYASEGACRAAHSIGQCIPSVGADGVTVQGYVWTN